MATAAERVAVVAARNEADRIAETIASLKAGFDGIKVVLADDASDDGTGRIALAAGAEVVTRNRPHGKGDNMTAACRAALTGRAPDAVVLLCDGDLGESAGAAGAVGRSRRGERLRPRDRRLCGQGRRRRGAAKSFARRAIRRACGFEAREPISGQRAMRATTLDALLPFAPRYGMETGMTIDAVRMGARVAEIELDLSHRATGKCLAGFAHRGRQLRDIAAAYWTRRRS